MVIVGVLLCACPAFAGSTRSGELLIVQGSGAATANGDYISAATARNTYYSFFVEVPPSLSRLEIDIFDADVGMNTTGGEDGSGAAGRDRQRGGGWDTSTQYRVYNPSGTQVGTTVTGTSTGPTGSDNAWYNIYGVNSPTAGHWEVRVDSRSAVTTGDDVNAFGIRAHDGTPGSGGTELNVYAHSFVQTGVNPTLPDKLYHLYTYMTSGCTFYSYDFDYDASSYGAGSTIGFTSRTGDYSSTITSGTMSGNDVWNEEARTGFIPTTNGGAVFEAMDYGIYDFQPKIATDNSNGNYGVHYIGNYTRPGSPPSAQPQANTFRIYLSTDAAGAPVKPYLMENLLHVSGSNPPRRYQTSRYRVHVWMANPTSYNITFSSTNLVTANVPGTTANGSTVYVANSASTTHGTIVSTPSGGGSGNVTWNPGAFTGTAHLFYEVDVTPSVNKSIVPMTGSGANGTRATFVDETGNTSQTRATYTCGPLCGLTIYSRRGGGTPTLARISGFRAYENAGRVVVEWQTASQQRTAGFKLLRFDSRTRSFGLVSERGVPALAHVEGGGTYRMVDPGAQPGQTYTYRLVEIETTGKSRLCGTYVAEISGGTERVRNAQAIPRNALWREGRDALSIPGLARATATGRAVRAVPRAYRPLPANLVRLGGVKARLSVTEKGLYCLDSEQIASVLQLPVRRVQLLIGSGGLALTNRGKTVSWLAGANNGSVYFYAEAIDSIYTSENVYWLEVGTGKRIPKVAESSPATGTGQETFLEKAHCEVNQYALVGLFEDPEVDYWYWDYIVAGYAGFDARSLPFQLPSVAGVGGQAKLTIKFKGATSDTAAKDHCAVISVNGHEVGQTTWDNTDAHTFTVAVPQSQLVSGGNTLTVKGVLGTGVGYSIFYIDSFDIAYQRQYVAVGDRLFCRGDDNAAVTIIGFTSGDIHLFDLTNPRRPELVLDTVVDKVGDTYQVSFIPGSPETPYLATTLGAAGSPVSESVDMSDRAAGGTGDYLIVTHPALAAAARVLADYRRQQGMSPVVVTLDEIYNKQNHGIASPIAIRDFLSRSGARYVVLLGRGTFDYKNYMGLGNNWVPPLMVGTGYGLFPSDNAFVTRGASATPSVAIGRLPVGSEAEVRVIVNKMRRYERSSGPWTQKVVMLADDPDTAGDFHADSDDLAALIPAGSTVKRLYSWGYDAGSVHEQLMREINDGAVWVNYLGHGGLQFFADEKLLEAGDAGALSCQGRAPFVSALTCNTANHTMPTIQCLASSLALSGDGPIAFIGLSGMTENSENKRFGQCLLVQFRAHSLRGPSVPVGDIVVGAYRRYAAGGSDASLIRVCNLLGDPGLNLRALSRAAAVRVPRRPDFNVNATLKRSPRDVRTRNVE